MYLRLKSALIVMKNAKHKKYRFLKNLFSGNFFFCGSLKCYHWILAMWCSVGWVFLVAAMWAAVISASCPTHANRCLPLFAGRIIFAAA